MALPNEEKSYFHDFDNSLKNNPDKLKRMIEIEEDLNILERESWESFKNEVKELLGVKLTDRGWQPLFDILNQIYAYKYLKGIGCNNIDFIPCSEINGVKTPDIKGDLGAFAVLCEVKSINISDKEVIIRRDLLANSIVNTLNEGLLHKLHDDIEKANVQLSSYGGERVDISIVFIIVLFDDWAGDNNDEYMDQIIKYIECNSYGNLRIVVMPFKRFKADYDEVVVLGHLTTG